MHWLWDTIIEPVLELLQPASIVEIGSDEGENTHKLLDYCVRHRATLYAVDPRPRFDVAAWQKEYGEHFIFHSSLSLNALSKIPRFDTVLIDGDHNWYTVFHELKLIEKRSIELAQPFPLVMLHDIGWPYGRRDLYYNPETVPATYRQSYQQKGMRPGVEELQEIGGLNAHLCNAICGHNLQNGVLTAIEDFLKGAVHEIELLKVPGFHGLGILVPSQMKEHNEQLVRFLQALELSPVAARHVEKVEEARIALAIEQLDQAAALRQMEARWMGEVERLQEQLQAHAPILQTEVAVGPRLQQQLSNTEQTFVVRQYQLATTETRPVTEQAQIGGKRNQALSRKIQVHTPDGAQEIDIYGEEGLPVLANLWTRTGWQHRIPFRVTWLGIPIIQVPDDIIMMQELIYKVRPDVIVETGVAYGGTATLYASMLELLGKGQVISIDIKLREEARLAIYAHPMSKRITLLEGSSTDEAVVAQVRRMIHSEDKVLVALDSNHAYTHVRQELEQYSLLVKPGGYIVVFDGVMEILADAPSGKPEWITDNPAAAVRDFLREHPEFEVDLYYNRLGVTYSPNGFLRRGLR